MPNRILFKLSEISVIATIIEQIVFIIKSYQASAYFLNITGEGHL